jgi:Right handed beta helix region
MTKTAVLLTLIAIALASMPAHAQQRVFVSGHGLDTNPCTVTQPCRTFQVAHNTAAANGEIDVLDPAGYGPLTITKGISIQAHGFGGITAASGDAITVSVATSDPVTLNGLLLDGGGTGGLGIRIQSCRSLQILNSVIRHFQFGIAEFTSGPINLLIEDTVASDNLKGIALEGGSVKATLSRITANNNQVGVYNLSNEATIANSVIFNNSSEGLGCFSSCMTWLAKTLISDSTTGVNMDVSSTVFSYGDNYIGDNTTPVNGSLKPVGMQ